MHLPELGDRGGGWVLLQVALLAAIAMAGLVGPNVPDTLLVASVTIGVLLFGAGGLLVLAGFRGLGRSLSVYPEPLQSASLVTTGVYGRARHPIYGGVILLAFGFATASSPWALPLAALLVVLLRGKSQVEERRLGNAFPGYSRYRKQVRRRFFPV